MLWLPTSLCLILSTCACSVCWQALCVESKSEKCVWGRKSLLERVSKKQNTNL